MERYPTYETYRALYARYHGKGVTDLLQPLAPLEGANVIDLCGGDGRLTFKMIEAGARSILFVDAEARMVPSELRRLGQVQVQIKDVRRALSDAFARGKTYDRAVCQQAVNYWLDGETARLLAMALRPGGTFVFNTFNEKPSEKPRVLEYDLDGHAFVEVSWLVGDDVHHLQARDGMAPHHTVFKWLSPERLREILGPYFVVSEVRNGKTSLYQCERR